MIDKIGSAAASYANIGKAASGAAQGGSFMDMLNSGVNGLLDTTKNADVMAGKAVMGKADPLDVAQAMNAADLSLKTVVAVRDKMVGAYTEIMRMSM